MELLSLYGLKLIIAVVLAYGALSLFGVGWLLRLRIIATMAVGVVLLGFLGSNPAWDSTLLIVIIIVSGIISHAPGKLRYYSVYHRKVISSDKDTKG